jgi:two-component system response regulator AtoC
MSLNPLCDPKQVETVRFSLRQCARPLNIMVIDDSLNEIELCSFVIESVGAKPIGATNAAEAMRLVKSNRIDLVLLDLNLPTGNAAELYRDLKSKAPQVPVVVITGMPGDRHPLLGRVREAGATLIYEKPLTQDDLLELTRVNA